MIKNFRQTISPFIILFLFVGSGLFAQEYLLWERVFRPEDKLVSRFVLSMAKDTQGVMWISTREGLQSYDGVEFRLYRQNHYGFTKSYYTEIIAGPQGKIWLLRYENHQTRGMLGKFYEAVDLFDPVTDSVHTFKDYFGAGAPEMDRLFGITLDGDGSLLFGTDDGRAFRYHERLEKVLETDHAVSLIRRASPSSWWVVRPGALVEQSDDGQILSVDSLGFFPVMMSYGGRDGVLLKTVNNKTFNFSGGNIFAHKRRGYPLGTTVFFGEGRQPLDLGPYLDIWIDPTDRLWVSKQGWIRYLSWEGEVLASISLSENEKPAVVERIFFDPDGLIWLHFMRQFKVYGMVRNQFANHLENSSLRGMLPLDRARVLVNSYQGARILNVRTGVVEKPWPDHLATHGMGLWRNPDGTIWSGAHTPYIRRLSPGPSSNDSVRLEVPGQLWFDVNVIRRDSRNTLWVGTNAGLFYRDHPDGGFQLVDLSPLARERIAITWIEEYRDTLWACTEGGLIQLDLDTREIAVCEPVPAIGLYHLHIDSQGIFWMASRGQGLLRWDRPSGQLESISLDEGLSSDIIYGVLEDRQGRLWLSSQYGLMRFDPQTGNVVTYTTGEGLPENEFNYLSHATMPDGSLLFGGVNGLIHFQPDSIWGQLPFIANRPALTEIQKITRKTGTLVDVTSEYIKENALIIRPDDVSTIVRFTLFNYLNNREPSYSYFIEGLDNGWNYISEDYIRLNRMPYGTHQLRVRANGVGAPPEEHELIVPIKVVKPWYLQTGVIISGSLGILLLVFSLVRYRINHLKREKRRLDLLVARRTVQITRTNQDLREKNRELEQTNKVKDKLFTIIGHELRGPIVSLGGLMENVAYLIREGQMQRAVRVGQAADESVQRLRLLIENLMNWGRAESGELPYRPEVFDPFDVLCEMTVFYDRSIVEKEIEIKFVNKDGLALFADKNAFRIIIMNLLSNAIKFTPPKGNVRIIMSKNTRTGEGLVQFQDSGLGISADQIEAIFQEQYFSRPGTNNEKGIGIGLKVCFELAKVNQGRLSVKSLGKDQGSVFTLQLPLGDAAGKRQSDHYSDEALDGSRRSAEGPLKKE